MHRRMSRNLPISARADFLIKQRGQGIVPKNLIPEMSTLSTYFRWVDVRVKLTTSLGNRLNKKKNVDIPSV
jgi:hypothetical protein